jgi:hypothetical protein
VVLIIGGTNLVYITFHLNQISSALQIPIGYVYSVIPVSGLFIIYYAINDIGLVWKNPAPVQKEQTTPDHPERTHSWQVISTRKERMVSNGHPHPKSQKNYRQLITPNPSSYYGIH